MQINIGNIPEEGVEFRFTKKGEWLQSLLPEGGRTDFTADDITLVCRVMKTLNNVTIKGRIHTELQLECCRCLDRFAYPLKTEFTETLVPAEEIDKEEERELTEEDFDFGFYRGDTVHLDQVIAEQILLQIPVKPLCSESCKGLCPLCGTNRNQRECNHEGERIDGPFAALKGFKVKKER